MAVATMTKTKVIKKVSTLVPVKSVVDTAVGHYTRKIHNRSNFFSELCMAIQEATYGWGLKTRDTDKVDPYAIGFLATEVFNAYKHMRIQEYFGQSIDSWIEDISPEDVLVWAMERPEWPIMVDTANMRSDKYDPYADTEMYIAGCNCSDCYDFVKGIKHEEPNLFDENCSCQTCAA